MDNSHRRMDKRRKLNDRDLSIPRNYPSSDEEDDDFLTLSLFPTATTTPPPPPPPTTLPRNSSSERHHSPPPPAPLVRRLPPPRPTVVINSPPNNTNDVPGDTSGGGSPSPVVASSSRQPRRRRTPSRAPRDEKITPAFPWSTEDRATVHTMSYLISKQIFSISGLVQCKKCERLDTLNFDLRQRFFKVASYVAENKFIMCQRAPKSWMNPTLPRCRLCKEDNSAKPVISEKKRTMNWLFLFLGEMLGCCTLDQLKWFCKHTRNHRTGAKDRVLFLTYIAICRQLEPNGPFDI
ncbi:formin BNI1 [Sesamum indicum]|uniref:Formin BNI1 n=1 Tax=Sesamum indicum TaxID=4182 RepID=A0A6I9TZF2_SESIN|nr:formin BNI1 [Sesamum indicum]